MAPCLSQMVQLLFVGKQKFEPMVATAFGVSTIFYLAVGVLGYWRYGEACCTNGLITFEVRLMDFIAICVLCIIVNLPCVSPAEQ